jgi:hypothetical protein
MRIMQAGVLGEGGTGERRWAATSIVAVLTHACTRPHDRWSSAGRATSPTDRTPCSDGGRATRRGA